MADKDTYSYQGWLQSDNILKRSFAILGHQMLAMLIIYAVLLAVALVFVLLFGFAGLLAFA